MNLVEVYEKFQRPVESKGYGFYPCDEGALLSVLNLSFISYLDNRRLAGMVFEFPINTWTCTDTTVGLFALCVMDSTKPVAFRWREFRKSDDEYFFPSEECHATLVEIVKKCQGYYDYQTPAIPLLNTFIRDIPTMESHEYPGCYQGAAIIERATGRQVRQLTYIAARQIDSSLSSISSSWLYTYMDEPNGTPFHLHNSEVGVPIKNVTV